MMSQHSQHSQTNGASLEDCHTNFFALTDLCGIKWRVFNWEGVGDVDPLEDPVLLSYSRCLSADVLCAWRRTWQQAPSMGPDPTLMGGLHPNQNTHHGQYRHTVKHSPKQLWVFWYGDEPDLSTLVSGELTKHDANQQGSWDWETGLLYECRTILFKALHNLIERCLLTRGFVRLGKWFVQPYEGPDVISSSKDTHLSFSLSFFVHGESTVCASVDIRKHPPVRTLTKKHILASQQRTRGIPAILAPYGLKGTLTGVSYRTTEPVTQKLLEEWRHFFPVESPKSGSTSGSSSDSPLPTFVEVLCGGYKLRYPTCFVLLTDMDSDSPTKEPPDDEFRSSMENLSPFVASTHTLLTPEYLQRGGKGIGWSRERAEAVWQDNIRQDVKCLTGQASPNHDPVPDGPLTPADIALQWEFADPASKNSCSCTKCKKKASPKSGRGSAAAAGCGGPKGANDPPFHWRPPQHCSLLGADDSELVAARTPGSSTGFGGYKGSSVTTPGSVPRMTGGVDGPPASVESPASVAPSPLPTPRTPHSQPASVTQHQDPTMPMLSPHQPPSNTSVGDPTTPAPIDSVEAKNVSDALGPKSVSSLNQSMSPYPGGLDGPKPAVSVDNMTNDLCGNLGSTNDQPTSSYNGIGHHMHAQVTGVGLRKPSLPGSEYDKSAEGNVQLHNVYDSTKLQAWLHHPFKKFRPTEPKSDNPLWPPYRPSHVATKFQLKEEIKVEIKSEPDTMCNATTKRGGVKRSADPYDFDEEPPGGLDNNFKIKEEKEDLKAPGSVKSVTDPLSPNKKISNLFTLEGLAPKESDLDDIFDSPVEDFAVQTPPDSNKPLNGSEESSVVGTKAKNGTSSMSELTQLVKMYPTPPSLEHNDAVLEDLKTEEEAHSLPPDALLSKDEIGEPCVFRPPNTAPFIGSDRYRPLTDLPSKLDKELAALPTHLAYNPTWGQFTPMVDKMNHLHHPTNIQPHHSHPMMGPKMGMSPISPATSTQEGGPHSQKGPGSVGPGGPLSAGPNYELPSPASNHSYLNKTLPSVEAAPVQVPEANSLVANIVLQDSAINVFRDHNFDSCTMCVCNNSQKVLGNIKGSDGTFYLPPSHLTSEEEDMGCSCGFSAVVNRRLAFQSGLFYEDEVDLTGLHEALATERKRPSFRTILDVKDPDKDLSALDEVPPHVFDLLQRQSLVTLCTPSSALHRAVAVYRNNEKKERLNSVAYKDGNETARLALEQARSGTTYAHDWDPQVARQCVVHKWCYMQFDGPACSQDMVRCMKALQPFLQEAIQKKRSTRLWEPVYNVSGPLTWRQFHRMAARGNEDMAEPLPIPLLLTGHERDWLSVAPQSVKHWEKLLLEPYTQPRNIAYVIVSPDNEFVLRHVRSFFKELSSIYELCRLGRHGPIRKVLRDGIMRVSKRAAGKVANEALDDWFTLLGDAQLITKLRMYSQICCHTLAPHLTTLPMDKTLFEPGHVRTSDHRQAPSPMPPPSDGSSQSMSDNDNYQPQAPAPSGSTPAGFGPGSSLVEVDEDDSPPPAIMIYLVDPFTVGADQPELYRLITIGLLRCYKAMLDRLPESMQSHVYVQIVSLENIIELANEPHDKSRRIDQLKSLAFSVFMQCRRVLTHTSTVRSLTGFGPAAAFDSFLKPAKDPSEERPLHPYPVFSPAYILAPVKESRGRHKEAEEALGDPREKSTVLYCTYCLSEDQKWLIATATDELGELLETVTINIEIPNRTRRKKASSRRHGLKKLFDWILGVMSIGVHPWRLVVGRMGRIGHGELKGWLSLLSRKSLAMASNNLKEMCKQCAYLFPGMSPCILSACLVSLEPDSSFRMMPDMFTPDERFGQNSQNCNLSTPQDGTCTHILVFPTSATARSAQQRFVDEPNFNFIDETELQLQEDEGFGTAMDMFSDILSMDTGPTQEADPMLEGTGPVESQPGSPTSQGVSGRASPSQFSGQARSNGIVMVDPNEDTGGSALQQQPLALGYYVSTASTGRLPRWFWSSCPHLENSCPTFLKSALHLNQPAVTQAEDYMHNATTKVHPLDSTCTADVLRFVLEGYNGLSWLVLDPSTQDRRSCLPFHMQVLSHLYNLMASLI